MEIASDILRPVPNPHSGKVLGALGLTEDKILRRSFNVVSHWDFHVPMARRVKLMVE